MDLESLGKFKRLFHNKSNPSSHSGQNDNFGFLSLFPQKVSLPNLEVLNITRLRNLETIGHCPLPVGSVSKLKEFSVQWCGKLLHALPSQFLPMLRDLEILIVERCNLLEEVFESEGVDFNESDPEILYSSLKLVRLLNLPKLIYISKRDSMVLKYIQTLEICDCDSLRCVFAATVTKSIPQLRRLEIRRCEMLSRIVAEENGMDEVEFPQLEILVLSGLPNLRRFCDSTHPLELPRLSEMDIFFCPSMDAFSLEPVSAPNLSLPGISSTSNLNNVIQLLEKERSKEEERKKEVQREALAEYMRKEEEKRRKREEWRMEWLRKQYKKTSQGHASTQILKEVHDLIGSLWSRLQSKSYQLILDPLTARMISLNETQRLQGCGFNALAAVFVRSEL
ncbi:hypothetical protein Vadar_013507 [Vaccinium darrowii]|uniref:Uncharacterized protein n=1 Tax=Vaccinium darrowii TaxID=229202 RepID=A0ACB7YNJ0_9ERIC|nr:hypothetical protein Vadar_013507 [Vaccinium darrowii]